MTRKILRTLLLFAATPAIIPAPHASAQAATPSTRPLLFEVATIKPSKKDDGWKLQATLNGYSALNVSLRKLIQQAYGIWDENRLSGGPSWLDVNKYDLEAKFDVSEIPEFRNLTLDQRGAMLQALLADRFKLRVHHESRIIPVYAIVLAKNGPTLHESKPEDRDDSDIKGITCHIRKSTMGGMKAEGCSMEGLAGVLTHSVDRPVVDQTGLTGHYDLELHWTPDNTPPSAVADFSGPDLFTALPQQLGVKLQPTKVPMDTIVVDYAEKPSEN